MLVKLLMCGGIPPNEFSLNERYPGTHTHGTRRWCVVAHAISLHLFYWERSLFTIISTFYWLFGWPCLTGFVSWGKWWWWSRRAGGRGFVLVVVVSHTIMRHTKINIMKIHVQHIGVGGRMECF